jgi:hypothetical protein
MNIVSNVKGALSGAKGETRRIEGTVADVFGHRFVVHTATGNILADIGPKASETIALQPHDQVELEGEQKPTEIKVQRIAIGGGEMVDIGHGGPKHDKHAGHHAPFGPKEIAAVAEAHGYTLIGDPQPRKKHFEVVAQKDGAKVAIHVPRDGRIEVKNQIGDAA